MESSVINNLIFGFSVAIKWQNFGMMIVGSALGTVLGMLPGLGPSTGIALLLPLTFVMPPEWSRHFGRRF